MSTATLKITGMTCGHCVKAVTQALESQEGVSRAEVSLQTGSAVVEFDETRVSRDALKTAVIDEGYEAEDVT